MRFCTLTHSSFSYCASLDCKKCGAFADDMALIGILQEILKEKFTLNATEVFKLFKIKVHWKKVVQTRKDIPYKCSKMV